MSRTRETATQREWLVRMLDAASDDSGMALATVVGIAAVLFLLASTLVMVATQEQVNATSQVQRTKALHAADAGLNAYLYHYQFDTPKPTSLSGSTADASWTVQATLPPAGSTICSITSVGSVPAYGTAQAVKRTVRANVRPGSFSDYMMLTNGAITLAVNGLIKGTLGSNTSITNNGEITGNAVSYSYSGSGKLDGSYLQPPSGGIPFSAVDFGSLQTFATNDGTYYGDSGTFNAGGTYGTRHYWGYLVQLGNNGGTITKIKMLNTTAGTMTVDPSTATSFTVPTNGVLYFNDTIWVQGTYNYKLTIVSYPDREEGGSSGTPPTVSTGGYCSGSTASNANSSVYIGNNISSADPQNPNYVMGIVAQGDISFCSEYASCPDSLYLQCALLSKNGAIHADMTQSSPYVLKSYFRLLGSECSYDSPFIKNGSGTAGFGTRDYWYDYNLDSSVPPNYPITGNSLKVKSWIEQ
jgi:hypothetical protein